MKHTPNKPRYSPVGSDILELDHHTADLSGQSEEISVEKEVSIEHGVPQHLPSKGFDHTSPLDNKSHDLGDGDALDLLGPNLDPVDSVEEQDIRIMKKRMYKIATALVISFPFFVAASGSDDQDALITAGITVLMAFLWITEAIPMEVTSLIPVALFPAFDIISGKRVTTLYFNDSSFIFIGTGILARAVEKYNLHKRIALTIINIMGSDPRRIILSFVISSGFMSMWVDNISTSLIMTPMAMAIIEKVRSLIVTDLHRDSVQSFATGLILAVTYANSIGGTATLTGTVPQVIFLGQMSELFPDAPPVSFARWAFFATPSMIIFNVLIWAYIVRVYCWKQRDNLPPIDISDIRDQLRSLGPVSYAEKVVLTTFAFTAFLWFFRDPDFMNGWSWSKYITDSTPPMTMALLLFIIPKSPYSHVGILEISDIQNMSWGLFIFIGGGFALSEGFAVSGLSEIVGDFLSQLDFLPPFLLLLFISMFMATLTEIVSNTAATALFLPIIAELAVGVEIDPRFLMVPATITASYAFMFPVATGPNAIAYNTGTMTIRQMAITGVPLNIIGMLQITVCMYTLGIAVYDIDLSTFPEWAQSH